MINVNILILTFIPLIHPIDNARPEKYVQNISQTDTKPRYKPAYISNLINVKSFGAKGNGISDDTKAVTAAIDKATKTGATVYYPPGDYIQGPITLTGSRIKIQGNKKTRIIRNNVRGWAFSGKINFSKIQNLVIDCDKSSIEGGIRIAGKGNVISNVKVLNADAGSICISSRLSNIDTPITTLDNLVYDCHILGQKRYHNVGGLSPLIASDLARNTIFRKCTVTDCVGSDVDYFDSDNAPGTFFDQCIATKSGEMSKSAAFWSEGEQVNTNHKIVWKNCKAVNFAVAFGSSEHVKPLLLNCEAENCTKAYSNLNGTFIPVINGLSCIRCGKGFENTDTEGVISTTGGITLTNVIMTKTIARQSFVNFANSNFTYDPVKIGSGCNFDKVVRISYGGTGSRMIYIKDCQLTSTTLLYYNAQDVHMELSRVIFAQGSKLIGARIKKGSKVVECKFIGATDPKGKPQNGIAIVQLLDNFNLTIEHSYFEGWRSPTDPNTIYIGKGNTTKNCTNSLPKI